MHSLFALELLPTSNSSAGSHGSLKTLAIKSHENELKMGGEDKKIGCKRSKKGRGLIGVKRLVSCLVERRGRSFSIWKRGLDVDRKGF